jgi:AmiR/NasT family two-component response regulator
MNLQASTIDPLTGKRAITVEDEGITQMQLSRILKSGGMEQVGLAMTGPQGVELALDVRPDIILMDINMPGEYDGLEAARRILQTYRACVIILTAYSDLAEEAFEIGAHGYVVKPLERNTLLAYMREAYTRFESA